MTTRSEDFAENGIQVTEETDGAPCEPSMSRLAPDGRTRDRPRFSSRSEEAGALQLPLVYRRYREGDETAIMRAFNEVFRLNRGEDYWRWKFCLLHPPMVVLAVDQSGAVQAQAGGLRTVWHGGANDLRVAQIGDLFARRHPEVIRTKGMLKTLTAFHRAFGRGGEIQLLYGFPNRTSAGLHNTRFPVFQSAAPISVYRYMVGTNDPSDDSTTLITRRWPTEDDANDLWLRARNRYGYVGPRDSRWLEWRFRTRPDVSDYRCIGSESHQGALAAWCVIRAADDTLWLCDLLWDGESMDDLSRLVGAVVAEARALGLRSVAAWLQGDPAAVAVLKASGWVASTGEHDIRLAFHLYDPALNPHTIYNSLYLTYADSDLI